MKTFLQLTAADFQQVQAAADAASQLPVEDESSAPGLAWLDRLHDLWSSGDQRKFSQENS